MQPKGTLAGGRYYELFSALAAISVSECRTNLTSQSFEPFGTATKN